MKFKIYHKINDPQLNNEVGENNEKIKKIKAKIGIFDSGVGGITFFYELQKMLPNEDYIYYGDLKNAPYGTKSKEFIIERAVEITEIFRSEGVKAMVIACNTATAAAVKILRERYPDMLIFGMEPALNLAVKNVEKKVIILSTAFTAQSEKLQNLLSKMEGQAEILNLPCDGLMDLVENSLFDEVVSHEISAYLHNILDEPLAKMVADGGKVAIVLGCTHYIYLRHLIEELYPEVPIYDGNFGTAVNVFDKLQAAELLECGVFESSNLLLLGLDDSKFLSYVEFLDK